MDEKEIKETELWVLYNKCADFARKINLYDDVDKNNRFYNGDQWDGLKIEGVEPVQYNFIKPIVNYKVSKITKNLRAINYSAENVENSEFRAQAKKICDLLNQRAARVYENDQMDIKGKKIIRQAAINGESIIYVTYDEEANDPKNEILNMVDVYYGNENESDIQNQPFILAKKRMTVSEAQKLAKTYGKSEKDIEQIIGDEDTTEEAGDSSKNELDGKVTVVTKFYKDKGTIKFSTGTKYLDFCENEDMKISLYPFAHMLWNDKEGSARGEGEVRTLIPNQIETNKTAMRRILTAKNTAYPQKVYNKDLVANPEAINTVGGVIEVEGQTVDDVRKAFTTTTPAQMSPDVEKLQIELVEKTRELANASETATGQVNPEDASGRAILAVQQASEQPLDDQNVAYNTMLEDLSKIWLEMWKAYNIEGMQLEDVIKNPMTGEEVVQIVNVPSTALEQLKALVKIDITPKGAFDKYAQELSLQNLAMNQNFMNTSWLEDYVSLLDNDAVMPKLKIEELIKRRKEQEKQIQAIQQRGQILQQQVQQLMSTGQILPREMQQYGNMMQEEPMV